MTESKPRILITLDPDVQPAVFDRIVAIDAGVEHLLSYGGVTPDQVLPLVHGAIFTRGGADLAATAIFVGGSNVAQGQALLDAVQAAFFGPMRVSVMFDANGANTTAAAAVLSAAAHLDLASTHALILGGTGPVGQRAARLLAAQGGRVTLASRSMERASAVAGQINQSVQGDRVAPVQVNDDAALLAALKGAGLVIAAGAAGVCLLPESIRSKAVDLRVAIDLNAVPPEGIQGVEVTTKGKTVTLNGHQQIVYGAIGVGRLKMKIHKAAVASLFTANDKVLDAESIYALGQTLK